MELSEWFDYQFRSTLDGFVWAVRQLSQERWYMLPPAPLGEWTAAQHVYHMLVYEQKSALPTMHQWLGAPPAARELDSKDVERDLPPMEEMLSQFESARNSEIDLLSKFKDDDWNATRGTTFWGEVSLFWLVCKTYQHTAEHTHDVLRLSLFWDRITKRISQ